MTQTDLAELVRARLAEKITAGKRPSKADLEWLEATREAATAHSSADITRNAKGEMQFSVKAYHADAYQAVDDAKVLANHLRAVYPMGNGTVGSPMEDAPTPRAKT